MTKRPADDGPLRFVRNWLRFDDNQPPRLRLLWKFSATVVVLLILCAMLASLRSV